MMSTTKEDALDDDPAFWILFPEFEPYHQRLHKIHHW